MSTPDFPRCATNVMVWMACPPIRTPQPDPTRDRSAREMAPRDRGAGSRRAGNPIAPQCQIGMTSPDDAVRTGTTAPTSVCRTPSGVFASRQERSHDPDQPPPLDHPDDPEQRNDPEQLVDCEALGSGSIDFSPPAGCGTGRDRRDPGLPGAIGGRGRGELAAESAAPSAQRIRARSRWLCGWQRTTHGSKVC